MSKMFWELKLPLDIASMKEDLSKNNIWKYLRYFNMYCSRFLLKTKEDRDISYEYFSKIMFGGIVGLIKDPVYGVCVGRVDVEKPDANGNPEIVTFEYDNGTKLKKLKVGKDVVIAYADKTRIAPVLYIWAIANEILTREDIIRQQDNMLRKPIVVTGEGEDFDNAVNNATNVLSGIEWINTKGKKKQGKNNLLEQSEMQVLNLQIGNAYKGAELWDSRKHFEELICDYMGFTTTKNEKKERMNTNEVLNENSIGQTFYKSSVECLNTMIADCKKVLGEEIKMTKLLESEKEVSDNGDDKENVERTND